MKGLYETRSQHVTTWWLHHTGCEFVQPDQEILNSTITLLGSVELQQRLPMRQHVEEVGLQCDYCRLQGPIPFGPCWVLDLSSIPLLGVARES